MANKQKILIVDDDENIAELISLYLTKECFETHIVYDGESALDAVRIFDPNLIILDLMLPGIDGYQVCREVRATSSVPIIMLSAKGEIFDKVLSPRQSGIAALQGHLCSCCGRTGSSRSQDQKSGISRFSHQSDQLFCYLQREKSGNATQGTGAFIFSCFITQSGFYQRTALRPDLGI